MCPSGCYASVRRTVRAHEAWWTTDSGALKIRTLPTNDNTSRQPLPLPPPPLYRPDCRAHIHPQADFERGGARRCTIREAVLSIRHTISVDAA